MTATERLTLINKKLDRAKKHFRDLVGEINLFLTEPRPYEVSTKTDPNTGEVIYYVSAVASIPSPINLIVGDVLHNCRATLDHFAYQLVLVNNGTPTKSTCFPIFDNATKYADGKARAVKGMRQDAIDYIDRTKPYEAGNTILWELHRLNNIDKHRILVTTVTAYSGRSTQESDREEFRRIFGGDVPAKLARVPFISDTAGEGIELKDGHEFYRAAAGSEVDKNMNLLIDVMFHEPGVLEGYPVLKKLDRILNIVYGTIYNLDVLR